MNTDTPRTNSATWYYKESEEPCVNAELSRQLERELTAEQEKVKQLREALDNLNKEFKRLPHSLGYRYTHTGKVDAILEATK